jgi:hypothetical protein
MVSEMSGACDSEQTLCQGQWLLARLLGKRREGREDLTKSLLGKSGWFWQGRCLKVISHLAQPVFRHKEVYEPFLGQNGRDAFF